MGYTTEFYGAVEVTPPLNHAECDYLNGSAATRRMDRERGPYFVGGSGFMGQGSDPDVRDHNAPPSGQPGLWCQWVPSEDGRFLEWDSGEKFYEAERWMAYLIDHFLRPGAHAKDSGHSQFAEHPRTRERGSEISRGDERDRAERKRCDCHFSFDHVLDGEIEAQGEKPGDKWLLRVRDNSVSVLSGEVVYRDPVPVTT